MKKIILMMVITATIASTTYAAENQCNLPDSFDEKTYQDIGKDKELHVGIRLKSLEAAQVIITARHQVKLAQDNVQISNIDDAIQYLIDNSEAGDLYLSQLKAAGVVYTAVIYYPGGNPVGSIFKYGTGLVIGYIEDSTVVCK